MNFDPITEHTHNGVDSPKISYNDLKDLPTTNNLFTGTVEVLAVGGGGGGGNNGIGNGGGGEGGEVKYDPAFPVISHVGFDQAYLISIAAEANDNADGSATTFHSLSAAGGKAGGIPAGGSGGSTTGGNGGDGNNAGAGSPGQDGTQSSITGTPTYYGGGGGGMSSLGAGSAGAGGQGGGGSASSDGNGTPGTGGGGGGNRAGSGYRGGKGAVIVRYATNEFGPCTGGNYIHVDGSDTVHEFYSTGTFTVVAR
jgi:hypothetical protein